jgi:hypothetical protein
VATSLGAAIARTLPLGFQLDRIERDVVERLERHRSLSALEIADLAGVEDGSAWMTAFIEKLSGHGLDLIEAGEEVEGVGTYVLRT